MIVWLPWLVQALQLLSGICWLVPAVALLPSVLRTWRGTADAIDVMRGPIFFTAVTHVGFTTRWLLWPHALPMMGVTELSFWACLYTLSCMCAAGLWIANLYVERLH